MEPKLAVIRMRGLARQDLSVKESLKFLNLHRRNWCTVIEGTPSNKGMVLKVKDQVTWGEIDDETLALLAEKRGEEAEDERSIEVAGKKVKKVFRLSPPKGGFERKGTKKGFGEHGALGYRGAKINELIRKMI